MTLDALRLLRVAPVAWTGCFGMTIALCEAFCMDKERRQRVAEDASSGISLAAAQAPKYFQCRQKLRVAVFETLTTLVLRNF